MILGLVILLLAIIYFATATATLVHLIADESGIIGLNDFVNF